MPDLDDDCLIGLIGDVYEAALDPARWTPLMDRLGELFDAKLVLFTQDVSAGQTGLAVYRGFEDSFIQSYRDYYGFRSPWLSAFARMPVGLVTAQDGLADRATYESSEFYNDWMRPQSLYATLGVMLDRSETVVTNFAINCHASHGLVSEAEQRFFTRLAPHVRRSLETWRQLASARLQRDSALEGLERLQLGVIIADGTGNLVFANRQAEGVLRTGDGIAVRAGRLIALTPSATTDLQRAILAAAASRGASGGSLNLHRRDGRQLGLAVHPFRDADATGAWGLRTPMAVLFLHGTAADALSFDARELGQLYGLTPAEGRLLAALLRGEDVQGYATSAGISTNTVKTQLRQLFQKTQKTRQAELVRHVLSDLVARLAATR